MPRSRSALLNVQTVPVDPVSTHPARSLLIIADGILDIAILNRLSQLIHANHSQLPDLQQVVGQGQTIFQPTVDGDLSAWIIRPSPLG